MVYDLFAKIEVPGKLSDFKQRRHAANVSEESTRGLRYFLPGVLAMVYRAH